MIPTLAKAKISRLYLVSMAAQASLCHTWLQSRSRDVAQIKQWSPGIDKDDSLPSAPRGRAEKT